MMRPTTRILFAAPLAAVALTLLGSNPARAGQALGIVVGSGTVQPVGDPTYLFTFDVLFYPDIALNERIMPATMNAAGDSFTISGFNGGFVPGTLTAPIPPWTTYTGISQDGTSVTWSLGYGQFPITSANIPNGSDHVDLGIFTVQTFAPLTGQFSISFNDTEDTTVQGGNHGGSTFTVVAVPEPSTLAIAGSGAFAGLCLVGRRLRRGRIA